MLVLIISIIFNTGLIKNIYILFFPYNYFYPSFFSVLRGLANYFFLSACNMPPYGQSSASVSPRQVGIIYGE